MIKKHAKIPWVHVHAKSQNLGNVNQESRKFDVIWLRHYSLEDV